MNAPEPLRVVRIAEPVVDGQRVTFAFSVEPATPLYHRTAFELDFPASVEPGLVPAALWWRIALICLHPHLALLAPCRVELPVRLAPGEAELWLRLVDAHTTMLAADGMVIGPERAVELTETGPTLATSAGMRDGSRVASAFSGGKDGLVAAALLADLGEPPLLVVTTSPVEWVHDHAVAGRDRLLAGAAQDLGGELIEVRSDFRATWARDLPPERGAREIHLNELTDAMLYLAAVVAVAASRGAGLVLLAAECEVQLSREHEGRVALCGTCYSVAFLAAVDAALATCGPHVGTLNAALHARNAQQLLWSRWPELGRWQFSCYDGDGTEVACGRCRSCRHIAIRALGAGRSPRIAGIDPAMVLATAIGDFEPELSGLSTHSTPTRLLLSALDAEVVAAVQALSTEELLAIVGDDPALQDAAPRDAAVAGWERVRVRAAGHRVEPLRGYETELLDTIPAPWRDAVTGIFAAGLDPAPPGAYAGHAARSAALTAWLTAPTTLTG